MSSSIRGGRIVKRSLLDRVKSPDALNEVFASNPKGIMLRVLLEDALEGIP